MIEIWKDIPNYEGIYQISNLSNIKSQHFNKIRNQKPGHLLKVGLLRNGYIRICLRDDNGIPTYYSLHRIVAQVFIPNPENKKEINHINGIKSDNRLENLEWCTRSENMIHAVKTGLHTSKGPPKGTLPWCTGKNLSEEHKLNIAKVKLGKSTTKAKKIIDTNSNIIYANVNDACLVVNLRPGALYARLTNKVKNDTNMRYYGK
jgi:hypothetical protein